MNEINYNDIENLLKEIEPLIQQQEITMGERLKRGELFNIFDTLGVDHYEVQHSTIIANFLNPKESHGQKDMFLKLFLAEVGDKTKIGTLHSKVYTEFSIDDGRTDIFIENEEQQKAIIIENKIYAGDQKNQLKRYSKFLGKNYNDGNVALYYLTLDGKEASEYSTGKKNIKYKPISYSQNILNWIESCIKESATTPLIRETLVQYKNLIKKITFNNMDEKLFELMGKHPLAVKTIEDNLKEYKKDLFHKILAYVKSEYKDFLEKNGLSFEGDSGEEYFCFHKKDWKNKNCIICFDKENNWGISYDDGTKVEKRIGELKYLKHEKEGWPYGVGNFDYNYFETTKEKFAKEIIDKTRILIDEIKKEKIQL